MKSPFLFVSIILLILLIACLNSKTREMFGDCYEKLVQCKGNACCDFGPRMSDCKHDYMGCVADLPSCQETFANTDDGSNELLQYTLCSDMCKTFSQFDPSKCLSVCTPNLNHS